MNVPSYRYTLTDLSVSLVNQNDSNERRKNDITNGDLQDESEEKETTRKSDSFDIELCKLWEDLMGNGLFRYKLSRNCLPHKVVDGRFNYIAQLNPERAEKRRKPQEIECVNQPYNPDDFNFNKVSEKEILLRLSPWHSSPENNDEHLLLINVSPLEYGHVLLTPFRNLGRPQNVTKDGLRLALELCLLSKSCDFRLGFNSLCGFASVNHEHYHAYYLSHRLFIEDASLSVVAQDIYELEDALFPPGFCVLLKQDGDLENALNVLLKLTTYLQENNIAHNVFVVRGASSNSNKGRFDAVRVFVWARTSSFGAKGCDAFNPALCELAGHFPIKNEVAYASLTEEFILTELHGICDEPFQQVRTWIVANFV